MIDLHVSFFSLDLSFFFLLVLLAVLGSQSPSLFFVFLCVSLCTYVSEDERNLCDAIREKKQKMTLFFFVGSLASCLFFFQKHPHTRARGLQQILCSVFFSLFIVDVVVLLSLSHTCARARSFTCIDNRLR